MAGFSLGCVTLLIAVAVAQSKPSTRDHHKLLLLCFDGLKWSYYNHVKDMKGFRHFETNGVRAKYMKPSAFPTLTMPSFTTLATGLYTESHGVVHNSYYDLRNNFTTHFGYRESLSINEWWDNGQEPIWITAQNQGLKSGGYAYPGINLVYRGRTALKAIQDTVISAHDERWQERVDATLKWLAEDKFDFAALYIGEPDEFSHAHGPESTEVLDTILPLVDRTLQHLITKANEIGLADDLNIILSSDHGMLNVKPSSKGDDAICIMKYLRHEWIAFQYTSGPTGLIEPHPEHKERVYSILKASTKHMDVYYKEDLPERFHYKNNDRIPSIVLVAHPGHSIYSYHPDRDVKGDHGYDNDLEDMRVLFYALGPSFKKQTLIEGFESVNVYPLMCYLLGLTPAPNNGSLEVLFPTVKTEETPSVTTEWIVVACGVILLLAVTWLRFHRKNKPHVH